MPAIHIRNVPAEDLDALKRRAARHQRSLQAELRVILAKIAREEPRVEPLPPLELHLSESRDDDSDRTWRRVDIYGDDGR